MLEKVVGLINTDDKKRLFSNFFSLFILQILTYLLPLITLPYLVRVLGVGNFGLIAFATAVISYCQIIVDYGFNYTATREISLHRENKNKLIEIFSSVFTIKLFLILISALLICCLIFFIDKFSKDRIIYVSTFGLVIGQMLFPIWFFQGMERMKYITYLNIVSKTIFTIAIFIFIRKSSDYYLVPIINSLGFVVVGILSLVIIKRQFEVVFKVQTFDKIIFYFKDGWYVFISNLAVSLYTLTTTVLLGLFTNNIFVGYYSIADKLISAFKGMITPISQALFPYITRIASKSKMQALAILKKLVYLLGSIMLLISLVLFIFADIIIVKIFGTNNTYETISLLRILSIIPFLVSLDTIFGTLNMLVFKKNKEYSNIILSAGLLNLVIALFLIPFYKHVGAAITVLIVESYITFRLALYTQNSPLNIFGGYRE